jgi:beta-lactamase superfamily II metal-dependent hydrolase
MRIAMRMRWYCTAVVIICLLFATRATGARGSSPFSGASATGTLDIYFIDVEGGQSTLIVTPARESLLVDTGYGGNDGRDAKRIVAAATAAGISRIDYLLITHFHGDHVGGVPDLAARLPIASFVDHDNITAGDTLSRAAFDAYARVRASGRHLVAKAGDRLPVEGADVRVVSSGGSILAAPLAGGGTPNTACDSSAPGAAEPIENPRSTGIHLTFGRFRFIDLGDLSGAPLYGLFCPKNLLGPADVYLVTHHGGSDVVYPATFAISPRVAIMNNGEQKGGSPVSFVALRRVKTLQDVWQLHKSRAEGAENFPDARVANLDETTAYWIKVSASDNGTFTVTNARTSETKKY